VGRVNFEIVQRPRIEATEIGFSIARVFGTPKSWKKARGGGRRRGKTAVEPVFDENRLTGEANGKQIRRRRRKGWTQS